MQKLRVDAGAYNVWKTRRQRLWKFSAGIIGYRLTILIQLILGGTPTGKAMQVNFYPLFVEVNYFVKQIHHASIICRPRNVKCDDM